MEGVGQDKYPRIQEALRLGGPRDIYYYSRESVHKQSIATVVDNRFQQNLMALGAGSSTFIIAVDQGISDILLSATLPDQGQYGADYTDLAVPQGWLYQLINRISIRYAGSSQYFWTGAQCMVESLREMPNPTTRDQLMQVGGVYRQGITGSYAFNGAANASLRQAFAYLKFPHNSPNGSLMKPNPFPSELLHQPIVVTAELNPLASIFSTDAAGGSLSGVPTQLSKGFFQVKQVHAQQNSDLMNSPSDRSKAYSFPTVAFYQNEVQIPVAAGQTEFLLTGFRNGEVRSIILWVTDNADTAPTTGAAFARNQFKFVLPTDVQLKYNGTVYYDAPGYSSEFWNLVSTETPSQVANVYPDISGGAIVRSADTSKWIEIPFSQVYEQLSGAHMYVAGKKIENAVVNLSMVMPDPTKLYTIHAVYAYNCVMMVSGGSCEYAF
jgi:hypothetical protein